MGRYLDTVSLLFIVRESKEAYHRPILPSLGTVVDEAVREGLYVWNCEGMDVRVRHVDEKERVQACNGTRGGMFDVVNIRCDWKNTVFRVSRRNR